MNPVTGYSDPEAQRNAVVNRDARAANNRPRTLNR